jgi:hypothetical protein
MYLDGRVPDVMIFKNFLPKILATKLAFSDQNIASVFANIGARYWLVRKKR